MDAREAALGGRSIRGFRPVKSKLAPLDVLVCSISRC